MTFLQHLLVKIFSKKKPHTDCSGASSSSVGKLIGRFFNGMFFSAEESIGIG
jgi:hypothetical protein